MTVLSRTSGVNRTLAGSLPGSVRSAAPGSAVRAPSGWPVGRLPEISAIRRVPDHNCRPAALLVADRSRNIAAPLWGVITFTRLPSGTAGAGQPA